MGDKGSCGIVISEKEDSPCTRKSSLTLAAFRPWGSSQDDATRGASDQSSRQRPRCTKRAVHARIGAGADAFVLSDQWDGSHSATAISHCRHHSDKLSRGGFA